MPTSSLQLAGLASGFDWKTFVDTIIQADSAPITRLQTEQSSNSSKIAAFSTLTSKISDLQSSSQALASAGLFSGTTLSSSNASSSWALSSSTSTPPGNYAIAVSRLATTSKITGTSDLAAGLSASTDVSGVTLASMPTAAAVTPGIFTINGAQVTIAVTDSLQDVFGKISTATGSAVTASYDPATDHIKLDSASGIVLGAGNDTSNFLAVAKLANNGSNAIASSGSLGVVKQSSSLATSGLRTAITAVDGSGNGAFTINGVSISYNANSDTLSSVIGKINASSAGVTATYDAAGDRMTLSNKNTGNVGINVSEAAGGFLGAVGISGGTTSYGVDAQYTVNGGSTLTSASNTLNPASHGIPGLSVTVNSLSTETISVASDTKSMQAAVTDFITKFNAVQQYISDQTKITTSNGKVTTSLLANNREIQGWASTFRSTAFAAVSGVSGTVQRLENLGIDFSPGTSQLKITDSAKLTAALQDHPTDVAAFFNTSSTGFAAKLSSFTTTILGTGDLSTGLLNAQTKTLTKANSGIDIQIAVIQRQLDAERAKLSSGFQAMESAESKIQQMQAQLNSAFPTTTSK